MKSLTIADLQSNVKDLMKAHNFSRNPFERAAHLSTETGEVIKALILLQALPAPDDKISEIAQKDCKEELGKEIFDLIWNALAIAEVTGVSIEDAMRSKMKENKTRKFRTTIKR